MGKRFLAALLAGVVLLAGCGSATKSAGQPQTQSPAAIVTITAADLAARLKAGEQPVIVDVRTPEEFATGHINGAKLAPLQTVETEVKALGLAKGQEIILVCRSGNRSAQAYQILAQQGYANLRNMEGGMIAWEQAGAPIVK